MAFANLGFETEDPNAPGLPDVWTTSLVATAEEAAAFDDGQTTPPEFPIPFEGFEGGWSTNETYTFAYADPVDLGELDPAIFDSAIPGEFDEGVEDFEEGWSTNQSYLFAMGSITAASFDGNVHVTAADGPYVMALGDQIAITTDLGGPSNTPALTGTLASHHAASTSAGPPIGFDAGGETFRIHFNGPQGSPRGTLDVTVDAGDLDVSDVALAINTQATLAGVGGELTAGVINLVLFIRSDVEGYNSQIAVTNVSYVDTLQRIGFSAAQIGVLNGSFGTGNVALIDEVPATDLETLINGDAGLGAIGAKATVTPSGGLRVHTNPGGTVVVDDGTGTPATVALAPWTDTDGGAYTPGVTEGPTGLTPELVEDYEDGWSLNESFLFNWAAVVAGPGEDAADFDTSPPEAVEDFEEEWRSNEAFSFTMGATTGAVFDTGTGGASEAVEDFEEVNALGVVVVNPGTDIFTKTAHGMSVDQIVTFENEGGQLPAGVNAKTNYFLINVTANTFQISATSGGSAIDVTDTGTGTQRVRPDRATFWTTQMVTL